MTDYLMVWNCHYCETTGILGYIYVCPGCSKPRDRKVVFLDPPTPIIATAEQMELVGGHDPNWYCLYCDCGNKQPDNKCWRCGAPRGQAPDHAQFDLGSDGKTFTTEEEKKNFEANAVPIPRDRREEPADDPYNPPVVEPRIKPATPQRQETYQDRIERQLEEVGFNENSAMLGVFIKGGVIALAIGLFVFLIWFFGFNTHDVKATVVGHSWSQSVTIEEYQTLHKSGWSVPFGGRQTNSERRKNGQDRISDGYFPEPYNTTCPVTNYVSKTCWVDNGNGSKSSSECGGNVTTYEPCVKTRQVEKYHYVDHYDQWYWYDIDEWVVLQTLNTSGSDHNPYFNVDVSAAGENQRRIEHEGVYTVYFSCSEPGDFKNDYSKGDWSQFDLGEEFTVKVNPIHKIVRYPSLVNLK